MFNRIEIAQKAANFAVLAVVTKQARNTITNHTSMEEDDLTVIVASSTVGWMVSTHFEDTVNEAVVKAFAWIDKKRNKLEAAK